MRVIRQLHSGLKTVYRACAPSVLRGSKLADTLKAWLYRLLPKSVIYDEDFLNSVIDRPAVVAAPVIVSSVVRDLKPSSVLDVGCGSGAMLCALQEQNVKAQGLEFADPALTLCRQRGLDVSKMDLRSPDLDRLPQKYDVVMSMEVAEHLPEKSAKGYVRLLCECAPVVVFTAAPPGQGGTDHLNEQLMEYWVGLFKQHAFFSDLMLVETWRREWAASGKVVAWYTDNLMIFRSGD